MSQEKLLLQLIERHRELAAAGEIVDMFMGEGRDPTVRHNLARLSVDGYKAEGKSFADKLARANFRVALMEKHGTFWAESAEWKAHKAYGPERVNRIVGSHQ